MITEQPPVTVRFKGEDRPLRYDFAAFRAIQDRTRKSIIRDGYTSEDLKDETFFIVALWAGLRHAMPDLTIQEVERSLMLRDYADYAGAIMEALKQSAGEPTEDPASPSDESANPPNAHSDGRISGP